MAESVTTYRDVLLSHILTFWRPGSRGDDWTWMDEYADLVDHFTTKDIRSKARRLGIGFADEVGPVHLGSDGRVWDGHHRIVVAIDRGDTSLWCRVEQNYRDGGE